MPYTLNFSDPTKQTQVTVPDMPPGINTVDTSLSLVGRGYPNYGQKFAENFLHLLENFASPLPPENPIEGQLWYDTSDPHNKVLRIMDGTANAVKWPSATGIYQQSTDPNNNYTVKNGDIWVDTAQNKLKIWDGLAWLIVGPTGDTSDSELTGAIPEQIAAIDGNSYWVVKNYVNGDVISIVTGLTTGSFTPSSVIQGFVQLKPGINMSSRILSLGSSQVYGTAQSANGLTVGTSNYSSSEFLRKSDTSIDSNGIPNQVITGGVAFRPATTVGTLGKDGLVILPQTQTTQYVQLYKNGSNGILLNNTVGGQLQFKVNPTGITTDLLTSMLIDPASGVTVNTNTHINSNASIDGSLSVISGANFSSSVSVGTNLTVTGTTIADDDVTVSGQLYINWNDGTNPILGPGILPSVDNTYDIGTSVKQFKQVYAKKIGSTSTIFYGTLVGAASSLTNATQFAVQGQVTATVVSFNGIEAIVVFDTSLTSDAITSQKEINTGSSTLTLLVVDTSTSAVVTGPAKISRKNFLKDVSFPGMITAYGSNVAPTGWKLCDGSQYSTTAYADLFAVIGYTYGGSGLNFNVPTLTTPDSHNNTIYYIIKY
jgi:Phage Tail Collar Domain